MDYTVVRHQETRQNKNESRAGRPTNEQFGLFICYLIAYQTFRII